MANQSRLKKLIFPLGALAFILLFGFISWLFRGHGTIGLLRVTPVFLYGLIVIFVVGVTFAGLYLWYWGLALKGKEKRGLYSTLLVTTVIFIGLFTFAFIETGILPPSKAIQPVIQLPAPDTKNEELHFAAGSDAHFGAGTNSPDKTAAMLEQIANPSNKYDLFFSLGDLVEYGFKDNQWREALDTLSMTAKTVPTFFVPGNHDAMFGGLKRYLAYCGPVAENTQSSSRLWQRIDAGNVHFLLLDVEWSAETITKEQVDWLEAQLKNIPANDWKIVMSHGFYYSSGYTLMGWHWYDNPETINKITPLFEKYGVDMVFSGHNHYLELLKHSGVIYVICGGFGGQPDPIPTYISPESLWRLPGQTGFAEVTIRGGQTELNFRDPSGNILVSYTIQKQSN